MLVLLALIASVAAWQLGTYLRDAQNPTVLSSRGHPVGPANPNSSQAPASLNRRDSPDATSALSPAVAQAGSPANPFDQPQTTANLPPGTTLRATVIVVYDGDTIQADLGDHSEKIRLIGIDTPEVKKGDSPSECMADEAELFTKLVIPKGTEVDLVLDKQERDKYGRLLAYVYRSSDHAFINLELAKVGLAVPLPYRPNTTFEDAFDQAAREAQHKGLGVYGSCNASI